MQGEVYAFEERKGYVAVRVGLTPKVIRFPTTDFFRIGQPVNVRVTPVDESSLVTVAYPN